MPTLLREGPYRFYFYLGDRPEPPPVHVQRDNYIAKFWLDPVVLQSSGGMRPYKIRRIERIIEAHEESFLREWNVRFND